MVVGCCILVSTGNKAKVHRESMSKENQEGAREEDKKEREPRQHIAEMLGL